MGDVVECSPHALCRSSTSVERRFETKARVRRLAAVVILWSGAQGHGRPSVPVACNLGGQPDDRKTSKPTFAKSLWGNGREGELNQYGSTVFRLRLRSPGKPQERN
jgi:hypothetical protein